MNGRTARLGILVSALAMVLICIPISSVLTDVSEADVPFSVTDGTGRSFDYSAPADRIVSAGSGATVTIADAGMLSKIVAVDKYSTYDYTKYEQLADLHAEDLGSFYGTTNHDHIVNRLLEMVTAGQFSKDDTVILTSYTSNVALRTTLESHGFTHVLVWTSITDYNDVVEFVSAVSKVACGSDSLASLRMRSLTASVNEYAAAHPTHPKALYVYSNSSGDVKVGNAGIMKSMLDIAGADNIGYNGTSASSYGNINEIITLISGNPNVIVFVQNSYFTNGRTIDDFYHLLNDNRSVRVVQMGLHWNNWNPESADGLYEIAQYLYEGSWTPAPEPSDSGRGGFFECYGYTLVSATIIAIIGLFCYSYCRNNPSAEFMGMRKKVVAMSIAGVSAVLLVTFFLLDISWAGSRALSIFDVFGALLGRGSWGIDIIVNRQNLPRVAFGIFVGMGLAVTGAVMQAVFKNPLATPYILGLSSGASLGSALAISFVSVSLTIVQPLFAFAFCLLTMAVVYAISRTRGSSVRTETLVLAGVAVSALITAVVSLLTYIAPSEEMGSIVFWSMGNLGNVVSSGWNDFLVAVPLIVIGTALMFTQCRNLNALMLGDAHAMDLGVDVRNVRLFLIVISTLVVAACVAFVGTIGFIGLVIPHIMRLILGPDNRLVLPASAAGGAAFILMSDYLAHVVSPYYGVLPIGVVTALIGAPFFVYLLCKKRKEVGW